MNEQIVITKNNHGIEIIVNFIDSKKKPVDISNCSVEITFVNPENKKELFTDAQVLDYVNGKVSIILSKEMTNMEGLWSTYWSAIKDDTGFVTAQEAIYYYVLPENGGAE